MKNPSATTPFRKRLANQAASALLAFTLLLALLPMLATTAFAAAQFTNITVGGVTYNAMLNQSVTDEYGNGWTWTASTNTLDIYFPGKPINGDIALTSNTPGTAVATINISGEVIINGDISCQGTLFVNATDSCYGLIVYGSLGGSLSVSSGNVTINDGITDNLSVSQDPTPYSQFRGIVKVNGNVGGTLSVSCGVVTINGTVNGRNITGGIVKVNGVTVAGATPTITTTSTISLNKLALGISGSGNGWSFDGNYGELSIEGALINYTLTGTAPSGVYVNVADTVNGSLTLDGATIDSTSDSYNYGGALQIDGNNPVVYVKNNNTLTGIGSGCNGVLTLEATAGATLTATGSGYGGYPGIICGANDLVLQGQGTFNFYSNNSPNYIGERICVCDGSLLVQGSVTVNATGGNYTGASASPDDEYDTYGGNGVYCFGDLTIAEHAQLNATGGNAKVAGCYGGSGIYLGSVLTVTSDAANALVATGGIGNAYQIGNRMGIGNNYQIGSGSGIGIVAASNLLINGTGSINAAGDNAIVGHYDITIAGCKITAVARNSAGYALNAIGGFDDSGNPIGGTVRITGGTTTASNITTPANIYFKYLNQTGGTYNGTNKGSGTGGDSGTGGGDGGGNGGGGGGGGGAPSLPGLALIAAMLAMRAMKKNAAKSRPDTSLPAE